MFESLVANHTLKETLAVMINSQRLSHALLLQGEAGTGKRTLAKLIAQAVLCQGEGPRPCGKCSACYKVLKGIHPDVITVGEEAVRPASFHIDAIRQLRQQVFVAPNEGCKKIYILLNAQNMTLQAQNALLKILEEPPQHAMFILICENRSALLETILSRCTAFTLQPVEESVCAEYLQKRKPGLEDSAYLSAAWESGGNIGRALQILESEEGGKSWDNARELLETICGGNEFALLSALGRYEKQKDLFAQLLPCLRHLVKEVVVQKYERNLPAGDAAVSSTALGQTVKTVSTRLSALQSMKILAIIDTALLQLKQNVNFNLILASFCAQLRQMM